MNKPKSLNHTEPKIEVIQVEVGGPVSPQELQGMNAAVSLHDQERAPLCSGVFIGPNLLLTAGHCLNRTKDLFFGLESELRTLAFDARNRACLHSCSSQPGKDLGILWVDEEWQSYHLPAEYVGNTFPPMVLLASGSDGKPNARKVCRAWHANEEGQAADMQIEGGDSGGGLVAVLDDGQPPLAKANVLVLGIAVAKNGQNGSQMFFTPIPTELPSTPKFADKLPQRRIYDDHHKFRNIAECP